MGRPIDPFSKRSRNRKFTGAQVQAALANRAQVPPHNPRQNSEFDAARLQSLLTHPTLSGSVFAWQLETIRAARDSLLAGKFQAAVQLSKAMRTDDACFVAYQNRLAPEQSIGTRLVPAPDGECVAADAATSCTIAPGATRSINGYLANLGVAIGCNWTRVRENGARVDFEHHAWPMEFVEWDYNQRCYMTRVENLPEEERAFIERSGLQIIGSRVPIIHGDGRWTVYQKHEIEPWTQDACLLPGAMIWAGHGFPLRDWMKSSTAHGNAKVIGEMSPEVPLQDDTGAVTPQGQAFLLLLRAIYDGESPFGLKPPGSKIDFLTNGSSAWQVFDALVNNREKAAARVWCGTDAALGAQGGAPGVDITALFGVSVTIATGDLHCIERGNYEGLYCPWAACNYGSSQLAPRREYMIPDGDEDAVRASFATRNQAFHADVKAARENGFLVTQELVNRLAEMHGVPAPTLAVQVAVPGAVTAGAGSAVDPDGDGQPGEPPDDESAARLAEKMTSEGVERCEHGARNRCRLCGIERVRDFERDPDTGEIVWKVAWKPIGGAVPAPAKEPTPEPTDTPDTQSP